MNPVSDLKNWKTAEECAELMGYSARHFKERISKEPGFPKRIGKKWYWPDIVRFEAKKAA